jgi:hypothetical protein
MSSQMDFLSYLIGTNLPSEIVKYIYSQGVILLHDNSVYSEFINNIQKYTTSYEMYGSTLYTKSVPIHIDILGNE